jgi:hypothetical protein
LLRWLWNCVVFADFCIMHIWLCLILGRFWSATVAVHLLCLFCISIALQERRNISCHYISRRSCELECTTVLMAWLWHEQWKFLAVFSFLLSSTVWGISCGCSWWFLVGFNDFCGVVLWGMMSFLSSFGEISGAGLC